jgi:hypothetical protein
MVDRLQLGYVEMHHVFERASFALDLPTPDISKTYKSKLFQTRL